MFNTSNILSKEQMEELQKNPYFDKYAEKIAQLQKKNPEEFLARIEAKTSKDAAANKTKEFSLPGQAKTKLDASTSTASGTSSGNPVGQPKRKSLNSLVKIDLLNEKSAKEIEEIWCKHFSSKDAVAAVIPTQTYQVMQDRFKEFNTFLFPLPRDQGYEFFVVQFLNDEAHFTSLINYQAHKENAPECLSMVHYTEMSSDKGIVLMMGEYDKDVLSLSEARSLIVQTIQYDGVANQSDKKFGHLFRFTYETDDFNHLDLIQELEVNPGFPMAA